jgi:branched-chain amino acid transport system substrate-binding protein
MQWSSKSIHRKEDRELFIKPFVERHGVEPSYHAAQAFAAGQVLAAAVDEAQSIDHDALRKTLASFHTMNIIGRYGVDSTGRQVRHFALNSQWQDGQLEVVWPARLATAKPRFSN